MKNIVICCDGTLAKFGERDKNTNVVRLYERLVDDARQTTFYDPGIATHSRLRGVVERSWERVKEAAWGVGIQRKVETAYRYLMDVYEPGDRVFLFGFSRGAYTVRLLAEMLDRCGLLTRGSQHLIPYATQIFRMDDSGRSEQIARDFKRSMSRECQVHFIGVWDTVASIGVGPMRRYFRDRPLAPGVRFGYHALSIDERRRQFRVARWNEDNAPEHQTIEQVWFAGFHADVGGQAADRAVSDKPLLWTLQRAEEQSILLRSDWLGGLDREGIGELQPSHRWIWRLPLLTERRRIQEGDLVHRNVELRRGTPGVSYTPDLPKDYKIVD